MKKTVFAFFAIAAFSAIAPVAAFAANIDVNVHTHATDIAQIALAGADAPVIADATATNIAGLSSLKANYTDDLDVSAKVSDVIQLGAAGALAAAYNGTAMATTSNIAGLVSVNVDNVVGGADIDVSAKADDVLQGSLSIALAGYSATASASNLAGVGVVSVNVAD